MQEEIESRIVAISIRTMQKEAKLSEDLLIKAIKKFLSANKENDVYIRGKQTVKELMQQNSQLSSFDMNRNHLRAFNRISSKYGIDYAVMKDKGDESRYVIFFKTRDQEVLNKAFREYCGMIVDTEKVEDESQKSEEKDQDKSSERESVREKLEEKKKEVKENEKKRREKHRQKKREKNIER